MTDAQTYKRANIDRKLFSKFGMIFITNPARHTAIAFAIALKLNLDETKDLLMRAGYALSPAANLILLLNFLSEREITIYLRLMKHCLF
jgi:hypothetical protein